MVRRRDAAPADVALELSASSASSYILFHPISSRVPVDLDATFGVYLKVLLAGFRSLLETKAVPNDENI